MKYLKKNKKRDYEIFLKVFGLDFNKASQKKIKNIFKRDKNLRV